MHTTSSITRTAFDSALALAGAHGHRWASLSHHPAVAAVLATAPRDDDHLDLTALEAAFDAAEDEDDRQFGGLGFALSHTTSSGRLSWDVEPDGVVTIAVYRPSLAWQLWSAQSRLPELVEDDAPGLAATLRRMLPPEPERGSLEVARVRLSPDTFGRPTVVCAAEFLGERHIHALARAVDAVDCTQLASLEEQLQSAGVEEGALRRAGILASQQDVEDDRRTIALRWWGRAAVRLTVAGDEPLSYSSATADGELVALGGAAAAEVAFGDHLADRLQSWAGMRPTAARAAVLQAFGDAGLPLPALSPMTPEDIAWDARYDTSSDGPQVEVVTFDAAE